MPEFSYTVFYTSGFKKGLKRSVKRGYSVTELERVINILANGEALPEKYKDHPLIGNYKNCRECHLAPDWLLIYRIDVDKLILILVSMGTHSDLF